MSLSFQMLIRWAAESFRSLRGRSFSRFVDTCLQKFRVVQDLSRRAIASSEQIEFIPKINSLSSSLNQKALKDSQARLNRLKPDLYTTLFTNK